MKYYVLIILFFFSNTTFSQSQLKGVVTDDQGNPVFAANVYLKNNPQKGVTTDFDGNFNLSISDETDTLFISFIGYETKKIPLLFISINEFLTVVLNDENETLTEVIVTAQDPISEKFSVVKLSKLDIYLNPVSQGDPLKAITSLPVSTTTDESANPSLRGSSADRTRVVLNSVPIYNPVRNSQINGIGNFSIFNTEIVHKQYVYASNPPLTYGNTSAGLVEIETINNLPDNQLQLSGSLANTGVFLSQKVKKKSFIQVFGNYQFSDAFIGANKANLPRLNEFNTKDIGINIRRNIGKRTIFNSFSYFIDEGYDFITEVFTYSGKAVSEKKRFFTVNNLKYQADKSILSINSGIDNSKKNYSFGNITSQNKINQIYTSADYRWFVLESTTLQLGISHDFQRDKFNDSIPVYYYALSPELPNYHSDTSIFNHNLESYFYTNWDINDMWTFSTGMRSNIPIHKQQYYLSSQLGLKYRISKKQSFLLSGGKYHNYATPDFFTQKFNLLKSYQLALDYSLEHKNTFVKAATYYKSEMGAKHDNSFISMDNQNIFGIELFFERNFNNYFKLTFSNTFINQMVEINANKYKGENDFNYFVKTTLNYNNPKLFSLTISYTARPGIFYTPIVSSNFDNQTNFYEPQFSHDLFSSQYGNYNRVDISLSRYFKFNKTALIIFVSVNNTLNTKNESEVLYNPSYSVTHFDHYQLRTIYFGLVWQLNY